MAAHSKGVQLQVRLEVCAASTPANITDLSYSKNMCSTVSLLANGKQSYRLILSIKVINMNNII